MSDTDTLTVDIDVDTPTAERTFDDIDVCARRFALGWRAVISAASDDDERQALYRTVLVEQHTEGLILVSTNTFLLLWTWIGRGDMAQELGPPDLDEEPIASVLLRDTSGLPAALFGHIVKETKTKDSFDRNSEISLSLGTIAPHPDRPSLSPELDQAAVVARFWREAVAVPVIEGVTFPNWRDALDAGKATGVRRVGLDSDFLKLVASVRVDDRRAIDFEMLGAARGVNFTVPGDPKVYGRLMPVAQPGDEA